MEIQYIDITTDKNIISVKEPSPAIVRGSRNHVKLRITFDESWNPLIVTTAVFYNIFASYAVLVENGECFIPNVILEGQYFSIGLFQDDLYKTNPIGIDTVKGTKLDSGEIPEPEPNVYQQILELVNEINESQADIKTELKNKLEKLNPAVEGSISLSRNPDSSTGDMSVACGNNCIASADGAAAFGLRSTASGAYAFAKGNYAHASGFCSSASGINTNARGEYSHAEGDGTIATGYAQNVKGTYNVEDADNKFLCIVGNGKENDSRSNAHTLDKEGNAYYAGDITFLDAEGNVVSLRELVKRVM